MACLRAPASGLIVNVSYAIIPWEWFCAPYCRATPRDRHIDTGQIPEAPVKTTTAFVCVLTIAALTLGGCSTGTGPDPIPGPEYRDRLTPEDVLYNMELAYEEMDVEEYLDCLAVDFIFYPDERDVQNPELEIPPEWYKTDERMMHEHMFGEGSDVESISLTMTVSSLVYDYGIPEDPEDDTCTCVVDVDLRVSVVSMTYVATGGSSYDMRIDQDQTGPGGAHLWEIYLWYELGDSGRGGSSAREESSWGSVKALYW